MKHCPGCDADLPFESFGRNRAREDGYATYCRPCMNEKRRASNLARGRAREAGWIRKTADLAAYNRAYRAAHPEKFRKTPEQERRRYVRRMRALHGAGWEPGGRKGG